MNIKLSDINKLLEKAIALFASENQEAGMKVLVNISAIIVALNLDDELVRAANKAIDKTMEALDIKDISQGEMLKLLSENDIVFKELSDKTLALAEISA